MLYLTNSPPSLIVYYLLSRDRETIPKKYEIDTSKDLKRVLSLGSPLNPELSIISYKGGPISNLEINVFNEAYLSLSDPDLETWKTLEKDWIKVAKIYPEMYRNELNKLSFIFELEALEYFWDSYKFFPKKLYSELTILLIKSIANKSKVSVEDLLIPKSQSNSFLEICKGLGSLKTSQLLFNTEESSLYQLFIGSEKRPPYIYYYLVGSKKKEGNHPELFGAVEILREGIKNKLIPLKIGAVLFNNWVGTLSTNRAKGKLVYSISSSDLSKFNRIIKG